MALYYKSVSNSIEQGKDIPVLVLEDIGIFKTIALSARRDTRWINRDEAKTFTTGVVDVNFQYNDGLTNEDIYKAWTEKMASFSSTYGYGGSNRYDVRFNVSNGYFLCSDIYNANHTWGLTKTNDVWADDYTREWGIYSQNYQNSLGFSYVRNDWLGFGAWVQFYDEQQGKTYYTFASAHSTLDKASYTFPFQGASTATFLCFDDIPFFSWQDVIEKSDEYGNYSGSGGYDGGSFDDSSDAFGLPSLPSLGVSEVGFVNVYCPTKNELLGFADDLFPDYEKPEPSTKEGLDGVIENLANVTSAIGFFCDSYINKGLVDYVIDCHIVPVTPSTANSKGLKVGFKTFDYNPKKVTSDYVEFDCGSLEIAEYYQNFLDYTGTRAKLYCPFIGFVDIKPEWFQSGKLGLKYHFNVIDGSCIAFVIATSSKSTLKETVVATFGGNCCVHMPITGLNYSSMISGVVQGASVISGGALNKDLGGMARGLTDILSAKPSLEQSNGYNAGMSYMCYRKPYLLIERPVASFSKDYPSEQGLPLNVTKKLSDLKGFTTCVAPVLDYLSCLDEEKDMIRSALQEGIIL